MVKDISKTEENQTSLFKNFIHAQSCHLTFATFLKLCNALNLNYPPCASTSTFSHEHLSFYSQLKKKLSSSWKADSLFKKIDKRYYGKEYFVSSSAHHSHGQKAGEGLKVLIIGAGPCGLRTAIEMACLGAKVVLLEKRDCFSRNNILHLWPFLIDDLKTLGAKKIYGRFCAGTLDHISIRQLQLILLKVALILGVEMVFNVGFKDLVPPSNEFNENQRKGWTAEVEPSNHSIRNYEFDMVVGTDGKRHSLKGFKRTVFRAKLAIGLTANFINRNTTAEAKVEELSGVAFIFNQEFFKNLHKERGIDLENIVYYKGETHYFVMTAKKPSLLAKGVLKQDYDDTATLLSNENVDNEALMRYTKEAAGFSTDNKLPRMEFAIDQRGRPDVALFDFTCMYAAENAALFREEKGCKLLSCLAGDSLLEPFWPMGTGCARGFLASFDATWMAKQWCLKRNTTNQSGRSAELEVLAERESLYRLLHQTTPENMVKNTQHYTIDPSSRYKRLNSSKVDVTCVRKYYLSDRELDDSDVITNQNGLSQAGSSSPKMDSSAGTRRRKVSVVQSKKLLLWCQHTVVGYEEVDVQNLSSSWKSGLALCAIIHRYRPDLIDWDSLDPLNVEENNQLAFDVAEDHFGIPPFMTGKEVAASDKVDKLMIVAYVTQLYEMFKNELPADGRISIVGGSASDANRSPSAPDQMKPPSPKDFRTRVARFMRRHSLKKVKEETKRKKSSSSPIDDTSLPRIPEAEFVPQVKTTDVEAKSEKEEVKVSPLVMEVAGTQVRMRDKSPQTSSPNLVNQRASNRISALSNQLISQWQQNSPNHVAQPSRRQVDLSDIPLASSSQCFFCQKRLHVFDRLSAEGLFFHRHCFHCANCGAMLRLGFYLYVEETSRFFCDDACLKEAEEVTTVDAQQTTVHSKQESLDDKHTEHVGVEPEPIHLSILDPPGELLSEEEVARHNLLDERAEEEIVNDDLSDVLDDDPGREEDEEDICDSSSTSSDSSSSFSSPADLSTDSELSEDELSDAETEASAISVADISSDDEAIIGRVEDDVAIRGKTGLFSNDGEIPHSSAEQEEAGVGVSWSERSSLVKRSLYSAGSDVCIQLNMEEGKDESLVMSFDDTSNQPLPVTRDDVKAADEEEDQVDATDSLSISSFESGDGFEVVMHLVEGNDGTTSTCKVSNALKKELEQVYPDDLSVNVASTEITQPDVTSSQTKPSVSDGSEIESSPQHHLSSDVVDGFSPQPPSSTYHTKKLPTPDVPSPSIVWEPQSPFQNTITDHPVPTGSRTVKELIRTISEASLSNPITPESPSDVSRPQPTKRSLPNLSKTSLPNPITPESPSEVSRPQPTKRSLPNLSEITSLSGSHSSAGGAVYSRAEERAKIAKEKIERLKKKKLLEGKSVPMEEENVTDVDGHGLVLKAPTVLPLKIGPGFKRVLPTPQSRSRDADGNDAEIIFGKEDSNKTTTKENVKKPSDLKQGGGEPAPSSSRPRKLPATPPTPLTSEGTTPDGDPSRSHKKKKKRPKMKSLSHAAKKTRDAARRQEKLETQQRLRRAQVIQRQLEAVEMKQKNLEERGIELEALLRSSDRDDVDETVLMQEWFKLVDEKNSLLKHENELTIYQRELQLEFERSRLQLELRERTAMDDRRKTSEELAEEKRILERMLKIVDQMDELVAILNEQKQKEQEEGVDFETVLLKKINSFNNRTV